jgi:hypothetical protein
MGIASYGRKTREAPVRAEPHLPRIENEDDEEGTILSVLLTARLTATRDFGD